MPILELATWLPATPAECFDLSLSVDAHTGSMGRHRERATAGVTSGIMGPGDTVTWRATHFGLPFTMTAQVTEHERPHRFVDEQVSGPFQRWWHEHTFVEEDGGTRMTDMVELRAPLGPLGRVAETVLLTRYMTRLLERRNAWLRESLDASA